MGFINRVLPFVAVSLLSIAVGCASSNAGEAGRAAESAEIGGTSASAGSAGGSETSGTGTAAAASPLLTFEDVAPAPLDDLQQSLEAMNGLIKAYKQAVESESDDLAAKAAEMAALWKSIRGGAEAVPQTEAIERLLTLILELSQAETPERDTLIQLDYELYQKFREAARAFAAT